MSSTGGHGGAAANIWKEFDQNVITHSAAHHLMAIDDLFSTLGYARVSDIARQLNITRGSVSISLQPLKKAGLVVQDENRHLRLSETGQALVAAIKGKRRLMERLLAEVLGVASPQAEIDSCKLEHLVSNETARQVLSFLRYLDADPRRGREFLAAWRASPDCCPHAPAACPTCETECIAEAIERPASQGTPREKPLE